jgi:hypothetical protein
VYATKGTAVGFVCVSDRAYLMTLADMAFGIRLHDLSERNSKDAASLLFFVLGLFVLCAVF